MDARWDFLSKEFPKVNRSLGRAVFIAYVGHPKIS